MLDFDLRMKQYAEIIEDLLQKRLPVCDYGEPVVCEAMGYSLKNGGKRVRPILVFEFCRLCGGDPLLAEDAAAAIEMIHTYSLIHDDLPCMDDDDFRRGKPSCHVKYGENFALLAGDALLTSAFEVLSGGSLARKYPTRALKCVEILSSCAGVLGMIGGQAIDLSNENRSVDIASIRLMDKLKTGQLIRAACRMGVVSAGGDEAAMKAADTYADNIGQAFQIVDDVLDVVAEESELGKPVGSDAENNKSTYVSLLGLNEARDLARDYTGKAVESISSYGERSAFLCELAYRLFERKK